MARLVFVLMLLASLAVPATVIAQDGSARDGDALSSAFCVRMAPTETPPSSVPPSPAPIAAAASLAPSSPMPSLTPVPTPTPGASTTEVSAAPTPAFELTDEELTAALADLGVRMEVVPIEECARPGEAGSAADAPGTLDPDQRTATRTPYARFVARGVAAVVSLATLVARSEDATTPTEITAAAGRLERWARGQIRWLEDHPPQRCYRLAHRGWLSGISTLRSGARDVRLGVTDLDPARVVRGGRRIARGSARVASVDFDAASRRCLEAARG